MRHYMVCPQNEEMLHKIPPHVRDAIREEAVAEHIALADKVWVDMLAKAEAKGQRDMLAKCIAAVEALPVEYRSRGGVSLDQAATLAALRALLDGAE
jgi:hypothetical protein